MPYVTTTDDFEYAIDLEWISVQKLKEVLTHMDSVKFALESNRQAALTFWADAPKKAPFSFDRRFPQETYVNLDGLDWPNKIRQMTTALNFKEVNIKEQPKKNGGSSGSQTTQPAPSEEVKDNVPNDVLLSFTTSIQSMRNQISRREGVFSRAKFEREYYVTWEGTKNPSEKPPVVPGKDKGVSRRGDQNDDDDDDDLYAPVDNTIVDNLRADNETLQTQLETLTAQLTKLQGVYDTLKSKTGDTSRS